MGLSFVEGHEVQDVGLAQGVGDAAGDRQTHAQEQAARSAIEAQGAHQPLEDGLRLLGPQQALQEQDAGRREGVEYDAAQEEHQGRVPGAVSGEAKEGGDGYERPDERTELRAEQGYAQRYERETQRPAERRAAAHAQDVGVRQRVAHEGLEDRADDRQAGPEDEAHEHAGQPHLEDDD